MRALSWLMEQFLVSSRMASAHHLAGEHAAAEYHHGRCDIFALAVRCAGTGTFDPCQPDVEDLLERLADKEPDELLAQHVRGRADAWRDICNHFTGTRS